MSAGGMANEGVAEHLDVSSWTVWKWRKRFLKARLDGLLEASRESAEATTVKVSFLGALYPQ